jgi:hypothetical protein
MAGGLIKPPRSDFDAHRSVRADEDFDLIFTWRLQRKVSLSLVIGIVAICSNRHSHVHNEIN